MSVIKSQKKPICVTIDLEDHRKNKDRKTQRYEKNTEIILEWLAEKRIKATFFTVGKLAENSPSLIKKICAFKHNIAFHSFSHTLLTEEKPEIFLNQTRNSKQFIEDLTGEKIIGFRAPCFSLTKDSRWVTDTLFELGFEYSSSTIPMKILGFGYPEVPQTTFKWESGLVEFPMILSKIFSKNFPSIGGLYLRYLPTRLIVNTINNRGLRWTYFHPQDIDGKNPFELVENLGLLKSFFYNLNKKRTFPNLNKLLNKHCVINMEQYLQSINKDELPVFK